MNQLPASTGWLWLKQGFQYFKRQPMELSLLFLGYLFVMFLLGLIPYIGQVAAWVLLPQMTLAFMQACKEIDQGTRVHPRLLLFGFRSSQAAKLVQLGVLYFVAAIIALGASAIIDGGIFWQVMTGQIELSAKSVADANIMGAMLFSMLIYLPALMGFWFAGPLIAWQQMSLFKAIFYSFFATARTTRAFLVYGLAWFTLVGFIPAIVGIIIAVITGNPNLILLLMMPFSMLLTLILYCSFYPSYKSLFDQATEPTIS